MRKPKAGDLVRVVRSSDSLIRRGSYGVIEGEVGKPKKLPMVTFNPSPLPWWQPSPWWKPYKKEHPYLAASDKGRKREFISSSGGPAYLIATSRMQDSGKNKIQPFHRWGPHGPGPDQAVVVRKRVHVYKLDMKAGKRTGGVLE